MTWEYRPKEWFNDQRWNAVMRQNVNFKYVNTNMKRTWTFLPEMVVLVIRAGRKDWRWMVRL